MRMLFQRQQLLKKPQKISRLLIKIFQDNRKIQVKVNKIVGKNSYMELKIFKALILGMQLDAFMESPPCGKSNPIPIQAVQQNKIVVTQFINLKTLIVHLVYLQFVVIFLRKASNQQQTTKTTETSQKQLTFCFHPITTNQVSMKMTSVVPGDVTKFVYFFQKQDLTSNQVSSTHYTTEQKTQLNLMMTK